MPIRMGMLRKAIVPRHQGGGLLRGPLPHHSGLPATISSKSGGSSSRATSLTSSLNAQVHEVLRQLSPGPASRRSASPPGGNSPGVSGLNAALSPVITTLSSLWIPMRGHYGIAHPPLDPAHRIRGGWASCHSPTKHRWQTPQSNSRSGPGRAPLHRLSGAERCSPDRMSFSSSSSSFSPIILSVLGIQGRQAAMKSDSSRSLGKSSGVPRKSSPSSAAR